jgi:hypothetical protein
MTCGTLVAVKLASLQQYGYILVAPESVGVDSERLARG